jgi:hypothetical protein
MLWQKREIDRGGDGEGEREEPSSTHAMVLANTQTSNATASLSVPTPAISISAFVVGHSRIVEYAAASIPMPKCGLFSADMLRY